MNTRRQKLTAIVLAALMVLYAFPLYGIAEDTITSSNISIDETGILEESIFEEAELLDEDAEPMILYEDDTLRTEDTKHYRMTDGSFTAVKFNDAVHYDVDGKWEEIDNTLVIDPSSTVDKPVYRNLNGNVMYRFEGDPSDGKVSAEYGGYSVIFELITENDFGDVGLQPVPNPGGELELMSTAIEAEIDTEEELIRSFEIDIINPATDSTEIMTLAEATAEKEALIKQEQFTTFTLDEAYENIKNSSVIEYAASDEAFTISYNLSGNTLKENIIVNSKSDKYTYKFSIDLVGLIPVLMDDGSISLNNSDNESIFTIPAPYMYDGDGSYSNNVTYTLTGNTTEGYTLVVTASPEWINASERTFPIVIDPAIVLTQSGSTPGSDIDTACHSSSNGLMSDTTSMYLGYDATDGMYSGFFKVNNLPTIPNNCVLVDARISISQLSFSGNVSSFNVSAHAASASTWYSDYDTNALDYAIIKTREITNNKLHRAEWEVTPAALNWYKDANSNLGITLKLIGTMSDSSCSKASFVCYNNYSNYSNAQPKFIVRYRNVVGIVDRYDYLTQSLGLSGTGYVRVNDGAFTLSKTLLTTSGSVMPFALNCVYNTAKKDSQFSTSGDMVSCPYSQMLVGQGWKLNIQQTIVDRNVGVLSGETTEYLMYTDADGTEIYFYDDLNDGFTNKYYDEDGMGLTITVDGNYYYLTDQSHNTATFFRGYLYKLEDSTGNALIIKYSNSSGAAQTDGLPSSLYNRISTVALKVSGVSSETTIATFEYNSVGQLIKVTDEAQRVTYLNYDATDTTGKISFITHNDNSVARYIYDSTNDIVQTFDGVSGYGVNYLYNEQGQVSEFREFVGTYTNNAVNVNELGAHFLLEILDGKRTYVHYTGADRTTGDNTSDDDDVVTTYLFDEYGRTVNTYSANSKPEANNAYHKLYGTTITEYTPTGLIPTKSDNKIEAQASTGNLSQNLLMRTSAESSETHEWQSWTKSGNVSISNVPRTGEHSYMLNNTSNGNETYICQSRLLAKGDYTFSAYIKTEQMNSSDSDYGVKLKAVAGGTHESRVISTNTNTAINDGWERISVSFTLTSSSFSYFYISISNASGIVYIDDVQLEAYEGASRLNLLGNGGAENIIQDSWTAVSGTLAYDSLYKHSGTQSLKLSSNFSGGTQISSTVNIDSDGGSESFVIGGWAYAYSVPLRTDPSAEDYDSVKFKLYAKLNYDTGDPEYKDVEFNPDIRGEWQFASRVIVSDSTRTLQSIDVVCYYAANNGVAYFDDISLVQEVVQTYKYTSEGKVKETTSSTQDTGLSLEFDENGDLIMSMTSSDGTYSYSYNNEFLMTGVTKDGINTGYTYDEAGNTTGITLTDVTGENAGMSSATSYQNSRYVTSVTDSNNLTAYYEYNDKDLVSRSTVPVSDTGAETDTSVRTSYKYDNSDRIYKTYISGEVSLDYVYSTKGYLNQVTRGGYITEGGSAVQQHYSFTYDSWGNRLSTKVGNQTVAQYAYGAQNGALTQVTSGNGTVIGYTYDNLGRIKTVSYNGTARYQYYYNGDGALARMDDLQSGYTIFYSYDGMGRLISQMTYNGNDLIEGECYSYDNENRLNKSYAIGGGKDHTYQYNYRASDGMLSSIYSDAADIYYSYDYLQRSSIKTLYYDPDTTDALISEYGYDSLANGNTTMRVDSVSYSVGDAVTDDPTTNIVAYSYTYDSAGNISSVTDDTGNTTVYAYDKQNQLVFESNPYSGKSYHYTYDTYGNIREKKTYNTNYSSYSSFVASNVSTADSVVYSYTNSNYKDMLTSYDGTVITYDSMGNSIDYSGSCESAELSWIDGRKLEYISADDFEAEYGYNSDGLRISKTVDHYAIANGARDVKYYYAGGRLIAETWGNKSIEYLYDSEGIYGITYTNGMTESTYYFVKNLQGDVMAMYDQNMVCVAEYAYDAWGNILYVKDGNGNIVTDLDHIGNLNPIRYRSYYYDYESGFYYLQSRYYDSLVGRFINADSYVSTGQGFLGFNMFAYCNNNPVICADYTGADAVWLQYKGEAATMGHTGLLIQDSSYCWWYFYWGPEKASKALTFKEVPAIIVIQNIGYVQYLKKEDGTYVDLRKASDVGIVLEHADTYWNARTEISYHKGFDSILYFEGDYSGSISYLLSLVVRTERKKNGTTSNQYTNKRYHLLYQNCMQISGIALSHGDFNGDSTLKEFVVSSMIDGIIPNLVFYKVKYLW